VDNLDADFAKEARLQVAGLKLDELDDRRWGNCGSGNRSAYNFSTAGQPVDDFVDDYMEQRLKPG
jgi:hypothetical protein